VTAVGPAAAKYPPICAAAATFAIIGTDAQNRLFCRFVRLRGVSAAWSRAAGRKGEFGL
jgi:hypothetical protein